MTGSKPGLAEVQALCFDIFGTVVDWRTSIVREGQLLQQRLGLPPQDWGAFADDWRAGYQPAMHEVRTGALPWTDIDGLHRRILDRITAARGLVLTEADAAHFNRVWHRLIPWPDSVAGLYRRPRLRQPLSTRNDDGPQRLYAVSCGTRQPYLTAAAAVNG